MHARSLAGWGVIFALSAAAVLSLAVGRRMDHHYDEFGYVYGAAHYTPYQLAAGEFEASNIHGFYNGKIGHMIVLHGLTRLIPPGLTGLHALQAIYSLLVISSVLFLVYFVWRLWGDKTYAVWVGVLAFLAPATVYLMPKLMSDVPALWATMASICGLVVALQSPRSAQRWIAILISAAAFVGGLLSRATSVLLIIGAWTALWVAAPGRLRRADILQTILATGVLALAGLLMIDAWMDLHIFQAEGVLITVLHQHMSKHEFLRRFSNAFGPQLWLAPIALLAWRRDASKTLFFIVWALIGAGPYLLLHTMEERYVITGIPGVAGLAVLGGRTIWQRMGAPTHWFPRALGIVAIAGILGGSNQAIQPKTISEINHSAYAQIMNRIAREYPEHPILVPWTWSDYHFLRLAFPRAPVYLVNSLTFFSSPSSYTKNASAWKEAQARWYGQRYLGDLNALQQAGQPPWIFIDRISKWSNTHRFSWIWESSELVLTKAFDVNAGSRSYDVYEVTRREGASRGRSSGSERDAEPR